MRREPTAAPAAITPTEQRADQPSKNGKPRSKGSFLRELPVLIVLALVLALLIKTFLVQAFYIPSASMEPTLNGPGDRVLVNRIVYRFHPPRRGDIIVFSDPHAPPVHRNPVEAAAHWMTSGLGFSRGSPTDYIKRVIGLPGDKIQVIDGVVSINGVPVRHERAPDFIETEEGVREAPVKRWKDTLPNGVSFYTLDLVDNGFADNTQVYTVPPGHYFMMGDNRDNSTDSRFSQVGMVPLENIVGKAQIIFFSVYEGERAWQFWRWPVSVRWSRLFTIVK
jgi:signal peptidase I